MNLVWFRNDLRLADNPALYHALQDSKNTVALFVLYPKQHQVHGEAPNKYDFIQAHVNDLVERLKKIGVQSIIKTVPMFSNTAALVSEITAQYAIKQVFFNASYWPNEQQRDQQVVGCLKKLNIDVHSYDSNYLLPPATVRKSDGSMYHVFTPYKNKFIEMLMADYALPLAVPQSENVDTANFAEVGDSEVADSLNQFPEHLHALWPIGEVAATARLKAFVTDNDYADERDFPAIDGTSSISPYLAIGVLSARQCLAVALKTQGEAAFYSTWVSELIWRDYYNDLMYCYPRLAKHRTFKADAVDYWQHNPVLFQQWQAGKTGFPLVDAGMRQLSQEGWMHNRVRMVVAGFLCKLCLLDWRLGEAHFMAHLLDGDLASNNGGWQWSSATGCDAAPYFRIFNPTTQSKKFDPDGTYIRKYVPELVAVSSKAIHDPKAEVRAACGYPEPVIDYRSARANALSWFKDNPLSESG